MTIAVDLGRKATKQTNKQTIETDIFFTIALAMMIYVSDLPWARVRFEPAPLTSC